MQLRSSYFFDLSRYAHAELFAGDYSPWDALGRLSDYLSTLHLGCLEGDISSHAHLVRPDWISIGEGSIVEPGAYIQGPCVIGKGCIIRHGAYIRGQVLIGDHGVIGNGTELKQAILFDGVHAAHRAYVGDSILGNRVNLGAGVVCANLRLDRGAVRGGWEEEGACMPRKRGAVIGDESQVGCHVVTNPGTTMGQSVRCHPCLNIGGFIPSQAWVKGAERPTIVWAEEGEVLETLVEESQLCGKEFTR